MATLPTTTLQTDHGTFICAESGGGVEGALDAGSRPQGIATADRTGAGAWETFTVHRDGEVCYLQSCGDPLADPPIAPAFGCAENEGKEGYFVFNRPGPTAWEALIPHKIHDGRVAFEVQCRPGFFLCAEPDGRLVLRQPMWEGQPSTTPGGYESFTSSYDFFGIAGGGIGIPLAGPVRVIGEVFGDDNGEFIPIGCHFGEAFSAWTRGRQNEVQAQVRTIRAAGYDHIRVWLNLGYYPVWEGREVAFTDFTSQRGGHVPATPDYSGQRVSFNKMLLAEGIRGLFTRGDMNSMSRSAIETHLHDERRLISGDPSIHFGSELANEKWQNICDELAEDESACRQVMETTFGGSGWLLQNSCPPGSSEEPGLLAHMAQNWFPSQPVHPSRAFDDMEYLLRHCFNDGYERYPGGYAGKPYAMHATEPGGPGQGVTVGNTEELWKILSMHIALLIGRTATVYMSSHGVFWDGPIESQVGFWEVPKLRSLFHKNAFSGRTYHGNRAEAWVTSAGGMDNTNPNGYARVDQLIYGSDCVAIFHHGGGGRKLLFRASGEAVILNWDLTERTRLHVEHGTVHDPGGDGVVIVRSR